MNNNKEFVARHGLIAQDDSIISGSLTVTGGINAIITGSINSASFASTASYILPLNQNVSISGSLGIGTATPLYKLHVVNPNTLDIVFNSSFSSASTTVYFDNDQNNGLRLANNGSTVTGTYMGGVINKALASVIRTNSSIPLVINGTNTNPLYIGSGTALTAFFDNINNRLGIGTNTPGAQLDVVNNIRLSGFSDNIIQFRRNEGNVNYGSKIASAGSYAQLLIIDFDSENQSIYGGFRVTSHNGINTHLSIIDNGNVGINNINPLYTLDVSGSGRFTNGLSITGSYYQSGSMIVNGDITSTGTLTAQRLVVQTVSSSIIYSSGSNIFGSVLTDVQSFTGSLRVTGSGNHWIMGGNVGIGTTSPGQKLDVVGTIRATTEAAILGNVTGGVIAQRPSDDSVLYFGFRTTPDAWVIGASYATTGAYKPMLFATSDTERMRITTAGNVGIGTTSPTKTLDVAGTGRFISAFLPLSSFVTTSGNDITQFGMTGATNNPYLAIRPDETNKVISLRADGLAAYPSLTFQTGGSERLRIDTAGNVGIGTTGPLYKLSVVTPVAPAGSNVVVGYFEGNGTSNDNTSIVRIITSAGTGTYTDIEQNAGGGAASFRGGSSYYDTNIFNSRRSSSDTYGNINFITGNAASSTIAMTIGAGTQKGNVGIGTTSPGYKLEVTGKIAALETVGGASDTQLLLGTTVNWFNIGRIVSTGALSIQGTQTGENNILLAPTSGNVGIGTTSPNAKLDVNGNTIITGSSSTSGNVLRVVNSSSAPLLSVANTGSFNILPTISDANINIGQGFNLYTNSGDSVMPTGGSKIFWATYNQILGIPMNSNGGFRVGYDNQYQTNFNPSASLNVSGSSNLVGNVIITGSLNVTGTIFGAITGSITSASFAVTSSISLATKANSIIYSSFAGTPLTASITFDNPYPNTNYSVAVTGEDARIWTIQNKTAAGFIINSNSNESLVGYTDWIATSFN